MKSLLLIFLIVPLIEIYLLIEVGSAVGAGMTIFLVVFTAVLGAFLVRVQGISTLARVQRQVARGQVPAMEMLEGLSLFMAGALLLTPGFFTDAFGFMILTPPLRRTIIHGIVLGRIVQPNVSSGDRQASDGSRRRQPEQRVIDGEYRKID
ncbi:MAG: FxsA family protein [Gammaproteobacteria bacterium]|nr:FxsA family protein [Gammaproteobacteria bacterium]